MYIHVCPNIPSNIATENSKLQIIPFINVTILGSQANRTPFIFVSINDISFEVCIRPSFIINTNN